ncbi:MAG: tRNA preQ1(34) S-adenosylmethionine ribosyltransferase-isomerase QueA [Alphaproteobacteria bacterium]|nr:tRNA preQ1(34) S-adenosylmethionine ribosyltransferase-isomerase QueA [Alphaproteobacteria bacterium]
MRVDLFDFELPRELIAQRPAEPRDAARLLHVADGFEDLGVRDLPGLLRPGDLMVFNDTRVIPARLHGERGAAKIEATLHQAVGPDTWRAFARPAKRLRPGDTVRFGEGFEAEVLGRGEGGEVTLRFEAAGADLLRLLERHGAMPLPPDIKRPGDDRDRSDYQTIFAAEAGAVAAPTAGLHATPEMLEALDRRGVRRVAVTLHVGAGTFLPVKVDDVRDHRMHSEWGEIGPETAALIAQTRESGGRVVAIGTTALRLLESAHGKAFSGTTDIFITPGHRFGTVDMLMTNFHLPRSTLFMLVCAFSGFDRMRDAYRHAIASGYRFYSYGDACLLHREQAA